MHSIIPNINWRELTTVVDKVNWLVHVHATFSDICTLLERNHARNDEDNEYLEVLIWNRVHCTSASRPRASWKVSVTSLDMYCNDVFSTDHFHLDELKLSHMMGGFSMLSACMVVDHNSMRTALMLFESVWFLSFGTLKSFKENQCFMEMNLLQHWACKRYVFVLYYPIIKVRTLWNQIMECLKESLLN